MIVPDFIYEPELADARIIEAILHGMRTKSGIIWNVDELMELLRDWYGMESGTMPLLVRSADMKKAAVNQHGLVEFELTLDYEALLKLTPNPFHPEQPYVWIGQDGRPPRRCKIIGVDSSGYALYTYTVKLREEPA